MRYHLFDFFSVFIAEFIKCVCPCDIACAVVSFLKCMPENSRVKLRFEQVPREMLTNRISTVPSCVCIWYSLGTIVEDKTR